jgi:hypothetical protein
MPYADPEKRRAYLKKWRAQNPDKTDGYEKKRRSCPGTHAHLLEYKRQWNENNRGLVRAALTRHYRKRMQTPSARVEYALRGRLYKALKGGTKSAPTLQLLGCSVAYLRAHLETRFRPGMTWENYGAVWEIDHVLPCAKFDLTDAAQQRACFHFSNLQPLFALENRQKGAKIYEQLA